MEEIAQTVLVTSLTFAVDFVCWGLSGSFPIFYQHIVESLDSNYAVIGVIAICTSAFSNLCGPMPGILVQHTSYSTIIALSGILIGCSFLSSSYVTTAWELFFSYAVLLGIGSTFAIVSFNFLVDTTPNHYKTAVYVAMSATGFGIIFFSCMAAYLLSLNISWRLIFRYYSIGGGFIATLLSIGFYVFQPNRSTSNSPASTNCDMDASDDEKIALLHASGRIESSTSDLAANDREGGAHTHSASSSPSLRASGWALLFSNEDSSPWMLFVSHFLQFFASSVPISFSIVYIATVSPDNYNVYYYMPTAVGVGYIMSRVIGATILGCNLVDISTLNKCVVCGCFVSILLLALTDVNDITMVEAVLLLGTYAFFQAALFPLILIRTIDILGNDNHLVNVGVQYFALPCSSVVGAYCGGYIYDATSSFYWCFLFVALFFPLALVWDEMCFVDKSICRWLIAKFYN